MLARHCTTELHPATTETILSTSKEVKQTLYKCQIESTIIKKKSAFFLMEPFLTKVTTSTKPLVVCESQSNSMCKYLLGFHRAMELRALSGERERNTLSHCNYSTLMQKAKATLRCQQSVAKAPVFSGLSYL